MTDDPITDEEWNAEFSDSLQAMFYNLYLLATVPGNEIQTVAIAYSHISHVVKSAVEAGLLRIETAAQVELPDRSRLN